MSKKGSKIRHYGGSSPWNKVDALQRRLEDMAYVKIVMPITSEEVRRYAEERFRDAAVLPLGQPSPESAKKD